MAKRPALTKELIISKAIALADKGGLGAVSMRKLAENFSAGFEASEYPFLNEATALVMKNGYDEHADFLFGLNVVLNGISLELKSLDNP